MGEFSFHLHSYFRNILNEKRLTLQSEKQHTFFLKQQWCNKDIYATVKFISSSIKTFVYIFKKMFKTAHEI